MSWGYNERGWTSLHLSQPAELQGKCLWRGSMTLSLSFFFLPGPFWVPQF